MNNKLLSLIALGKATTSIHPDSEGKIPAEYLPSYVDDIEDLLSVSSSAPSTCVKGDMYYNTNEKKIFTATSTNTWGTTGKTPENGKIYLDTSASPALSYRWSGSDLVEVGQDLSNYLAKNNTDTFTPTGDYNPATKKYVDGNSFSTYVHTDGLGGSSSKPIVFSELNPGIHILNISRSGYIYGKLSSDYTVDSGYTLVNMLETRLYITQKYNSSLPNNTILGYYYKYTSGSNSKNEIYAIKVNTSESSGFSVSSVINTANSCGWHTGNVRESFNRGADFFHNNYPSMYNMSAMPTQNNQLVPKQYVDNLIPQRSTLPTAASTNKGVIFQYTGTTDANYTNGYFYECVSDGGNPATYSWEQVDVQPQGGSVSDVQINNTSILSGGVANLMTQGTYNASTNKLATMSEVPQLINGTGSGSVMTNFQNSLTGNNSAIFGLYSAVSGSDSMFIGTEGTISKGCSLGVGSYIYIQSGNGRSAAIGYDVDVSNSETLAVGIGLYTGSNCQIVGGKNNISGNYVFNLGNGTTKNAASNAHTIDWSGNAWFAGDVYVGSTSGTNKDVGSKKLATEDTIIIKTYELSGLEAYDNTATYAVDDYVYYNNLIYKCNTAIAIPEDFDSQKWTQKTYIEYMTDMIVGSALTQNY